MAEYLKRRVLERADVIVAPTVNYSFYPAFVNYPGSTSLRSETARDVIIDICQTLAAHGPKRFYVLNTGVSTQAPLQAAQARLALNGIILHFTNILTAGESAVKAVSEQPEGTHADEIETSMMLYIAPESVDMAKATKDFPKGSGPLTPERNVSGRYSPSGIYGDATLATRTKGERVVEATVADILKEIEALRRLPVPK
jgi:creatinine amidohydrolase